MAFEKSPSLDETTLSPGDQPRKTRKIARVVLLIVLMLLIFLMVGAFWFYTVTQPPAAPVGGLEGCVVSPDGIPLVSIVEAGKQTKSTYNDGCFFFAALPPGVQPVVIRSTLGGEWSQSIEIISGQAVNLGEITISR